MLRWLYDDYKLEGVSETYNNKVTLILIPRQDIA